MYRIQICLSGVSEYISGQSAMNNLYRCVSVVKISATFELQETRITFSNAATELQHQHQVQGATVKVGGVLLSPVAFQSKGRWLNHVDVRKPHFVRR
jgi:hypothetical protein